MNLHGSIEDNLSAAIRSVRRLRCHPVHVDTLEYWSELLDHARRGLFWVELRASNRRGKLINELEAEIGRRGAEEGALRPDRSCAK